MWYKYTWAAPWKLFQLFLSNPHRSAINSRLLRAMILRAGLAFLVLVGPGVWSSVCAEPLVVTESPRDVKSLVRRGPRVNNGQ